MPTGGVNMQGGSQYPQPQQQGYAAAAPGYPGASAGYQGYQNRGGYQYQQYTQQQQQYGTAPVGSAAVTEDKIFPCPKMYMGRVIGQKGVTINDLHRCSGCDIHIIQYVSTGHDCQIMIRGARPTLNSTKTIFKNIIEMGTSNTYAGSNKFSPIPSEHISRDEQLLGALYP